MATYRINSIHQCNNSVFDGGSIIVVIEVLTYTSNKAYYNRNIHAPLWSRFVDDFVVFITTKLMIFQFGNAHLGHPAVGLCIKLGRGQWVRETGTRVWDFGTWEHEGRDGATSNIGTWGTWGR